MTTKEAHYGGFMLKCASAGWPPEMAEVLYARGMVKCGLLGSILNLVFNLGAATAGGGYGVANQGLKQLRGIGQAVAEEPGVSEQLQFSDNDVKNLALTNYYRRAIESAKASNPQARPQMATT